MEKSHEYTKYEKARMLGSRALQISMGAPFLLKMEEKDLDEINYDSIAIAKMEFRKGVIPLTVKRPLPETLEPAGSKEEGRKAA
ncbi:MAG: DNA-directed RNA polymerase subunit K [Candidatus Woesearchaeota archaeon]